MWTTCPIAEICLLHRLYSISNPPADAGSKCDTRKNNMTSTHLFPLPAHLILVAFQLHIGVHTAAADQLKMGAPAIRLCVFQAIIYCKVLSRIPAGQDNMLSAPMYTQNAHDCLSTGSKRWQTHGCGQQAWTGAVPGRAARTLQGLFAVPTMILTSAHACLCQS